MAAQLPHSTNRTVPAPKAPPERMKAILDELRKNQKKQAKEQEKVPKTDVLFIKSDFYCL